MQNTKHLSMPDEYFEKAILPRQEAAKAAPSGFVAGLKAFGDQMESSRQEAKRQWTAAGMDPKEVAHV